MVQWVRYRLTHAIQGVVALLEFVLALPFFGALVVHIIAGIAFLATLAGIWVQRRQDRKNERRIAALESQLRSQIALVHEYSIPYADYSSYYPDTTGMP
jgi:ammonia channel protein AmtB